jgi:hypothetical protein
MAVLKSKVVCVVAVEEMMLLEQRFAFAFGAGPTFPIFAERRFPQDFERVT